MASEGIVAIGKEGDTEQLKGPEAVIDDPTSVMVCDPPPCDRSELLVDSLVS